MANEQLNMNIATSELKSVFADNTGIAVRVKASKNERGEVVKEGQIEIIFLDMLTQRPVGRFTIGRLTAKELVAGLVQNMNTLEKELASKDIPKAPEVKPTGSTTYR